MTQKPEFIYGYHAVVECLKAGRRPVAAVYLPKNKVSRRTTVVSGLAEAAGTAVRWTDSSELQRIARSGGHQGFVAETTPLPAKRLADVIGSAKNGGGASFFLLLDGITDPQNLGALIRSAACFGVQAVIFPKDRSAGPTPAVAKASAGALEHIDLCQVTNMAKAAAALKKARIWVAGADPEAGCPLWQSDLTVPLALVVGGEQKGIRPLIQKCCDFLIAIPHTGAVQSLNASAAGAVVMYEAYRQRRRNA